MATIVKLSNKSGFSYKAIIRDNQGNTLKTKTMRHKTDLTQWVKEHEDNIKKVGSRWRTMTLKKLALEYFGEWTGKDVSRPYRVTWWVEKLGSRKISTITDEDVNSLLGPFRAQTSNASHNRMRSALSSLFRYAKKHGYKGENPVNHVPQHQEPKNRERWLSNQERLDLIQACRAIDATNDWGKLTLLVCMALMTGARRSELMGLRWGDVDFKKRTALLIDTKNGSDRLVTFPLPVLKKMLAHRGNDELPIFANEITGKPFTFQKQWTKARQMAGLENFKFHDLRHTCGSYLANEGAQLADISTILGHKSYTTTKKYIHLSSERIQAVSDNVFGQISM